MGMENFERPEDADLAEQVQAAEAQEIVKKGNEENSGSGFFARHGRKIAAAAALAGAAGIYQGSSESSAPELTLTEQQTMQEWKADLAPRESIPLDAFYAADAYLEKYDKRGGDDGMPLTKVESSERDTYFNALLAKHNVSEADMTQALHHKILDQQR